MVVKFWSSVEYGGFLQSLIEELNGHGVHAKHCFLIPETQYRRATNPVRRLWIRIQQYIIYPFYVLIKVLASHRSDIHVVSTNTFYAPLIASLAHKRVIHLVYDLYPEALIHSGKLRERSLLARFVHFLTQTTINRSIKNVYLGRYLREHSHRKYPSASAEAIIPVGADASSFTNLDLEVVSRPAVLYCGNFGHMHELKTLVKAWAQIGDPTDCFDWRFQCSGARYTDLERAVAGFPNVSHPFTLGSGLSRGEWVQAMRSSTLALITMVRGSETVVMPSKTYSAMCAGQAILAIAPEESDLVDLIKEHDCGWWVESGDVDGLCQILKELPEMPEEIFRKRQNAYSAGHEYYSQEVLAKQWVELFNDIMEQNEGIDSHR